MPLVSNALDLTFVPRVQTGVMSYEFEKKPVVFLPGTSSSFKVSSYKLSSPMPFVNGGVTAFLNSFFIDVYLQKAFSGSDRATYTQEFSGDLPYEQQIDSKFDRSEYSLSLGYAIGKQWAVFGGYRKAKTSFATLEAGERRSLDESGALKYTLTSRSLEDTDFKQDGYFLGATYVFSVSEQSVISLNAAIAALDGKHHSSIASNRSIVYPDGHEESNPKYNSNLSHRFEGDSVGLNLGVKWKGRIDSNIGYNFGLNGYSYDFDGPDTRETKAERTYSETVLSLSAGLSYEF